MVSLVKGGYLYFQIVSMLLGFVSYISNAVSTITNTISFANRPEYVSKSSYDGDYSYSSSNCKLTMTSDRADFFNGMNTDYVLTMFSFGFILSSFSLFIKSSRFIEEYSESMYNKVTGIILDFFAFCFSVSSYFCSKIHYGNCVEVDGAIKNMITEFWFGAANGGMWSLLIIIFCIIPTQACGLANNGTCKIILGVMIIYVLLFFGFALAVKFGTIIWLQLGWDIYILVEMFIPLVKYLLSLDLCGKIC